MPKPKKCTIMVVDDTPDNLSLLHDILTSAGYKTVMFPGGDLAIKAALRNKPDLMLLDLMMPHMSGFDVFAEFKGKTELAGIPIIVLSALNDTNNKLRAFKCGAVDYITKPFQEMEILARIKTHLRLKQAEQELRNQQKKLTSLVDERTKDLLQAQQIAKTGNWKIDLLTNHLEWGKTAYELFEMKERPVSLTTFFSAIWHEDAMKVHNAWENFLNSESKANFDIEFRIKVNDKVKWIHSIADYQYNVKGEKVKVLGTAKDITEKKLQIEKLNEQNMLLRSIAWAQSHSLRGPITRLMALTSFLKEKDFEDFSENELFDNIEQTIEELDAIVIEIIQNTNSVDILGDVVVS